MLFTCMEVIEDVGRNLVRTEQILRVCRAALPALT